MLIGIFNLNSYELLHPLDMAQLKTGLLSSELIYVQIPEYYTWIAETGYWRRRTRVERFETIGRMYHVSIAYTDFFLSTSITATCS